MKKKELEIYLSQLDTFTKQHLSLEQYQTESGIAADLLWHATMQGDIEGKTIADLGCGNGIFGIGALLLGATSVVFLDVDPDAIALTKKNLITLEKELGCSFTTTFLQKDILSFSTDVDVILQNPPFGVKKTHADKAFLLQGMKCAQKIYSFHKADTKRFIEQFVSDEGWSITYKKTYKFPLRKQPGKGYAFWKKDVHYVDVGVWCLEPQ